jgi:hypothetical protein
VPVAQDTFTHWRSRLAVLTRRHAPQDEISEARRNMHAARLRDQIKSALETAPELSPSQREDLAALFRVGDAR